MEGWKDVPQSLYKEICDKLAERDHKIMLLDSKIATAAAPASLNATVPPAVAPVRAAH